MVRTFIFTCVSCLLSVALCAEEQFTAQIQVSNQAVTIYESLSIDLKLIYPAGYKVDVEALTQQLIKGTPLQSAPFSIMGLNQTSRATENGHIEQTVSFKLQPQRIGTFPISFYLINFLPKEADGNPVKLISEMVDISVVMPDMHIETVFAPSGLMPLSLALPVKVNAQNQAEWINNFQKRAGQPVLNEKEFHAHTFPWLSLLLLFVAGLFVYLLPILKRHGAPKPLETPEMLVERAQNEALSMIRQLQSTQLAPKAFYSSLTDSVRHFIEEKYQLKAREETSEELIQLIQVKTKVGQEMQGQLNRFFMTADRVKFALYEPTATDRQQDLKAAQDFVSFKD